ncbi:MAG: NifU family protein [Trueperaceae bacterium]|nr:NifU family protein [Trueperaceae bacterium]
MLEFTDTAKTRIVDYLEKQRAQGVAALRVAGTRAEHKLWLVKEADRDAADAVIDGGGFDVYLDPTTVRHLDGATVDFVEGVMQSGFRVSFPSTQWDDPVAQQVQDVLDSMVNPGVASHGGSVSLVKIDGDAAVIALHGGCQGCGAADVTLKQGIEKMITEHVDAIVRVRDATDHEAGENPYYAPDARTSERDSPLS